MSSIDDRLSCDSHILQKHGDIPRAPGRPFPLDIERETFLSRRLRDATLFNALGVACIWGNNSSNFTFSSSNQGHAYINYRWTSD
ncbi:hypothetical protein J6590_048563 [Homalodisca vitripennis]|nr:hypothetical protein J6590_048563 [Homalodisca vitripennis]